MTSPACSLSAVQDFHLQFSMPDHQTRSFMLIYLLDLAAGMPPCLKMARAAPIVKNARFTRR